jgi:class 3 adenylate cyclase/tetratricopeptide (TPR) repeat protein
MIMPIEMWLRGLGLEQYAVAFATNHVTEDLLPTLTGDDLQKIGVASVGHRRRMLDAIAALGALPAPTPPASAIPIQPPAEPLAERRQVSVMFCDLVGSTELSARLDPEELSAVIRAYQERVNEIVARHGGFIARYLGDGVLIYFGWPEAREDDPDRAVRAALDIIEAIGGVLIRGERARVRIGIATGLVVIGERVGANASLQYTAIGETPNRAARLQSLATPNAAVIDAGTRQRIGDLFELRDLGAQYLAGLSDPVPTWAVLGETGVLSRFEALHGSRLSPFVGRNDEMDLLSRRWREARSGRGKIVMISGEPGIGKSRLVAELDEQLRGQPHIRLRYFCLPHRRDTPLAPFISQFEHAAGFALGDTQADKRVKLRAVLTPRTAPEDAALIAGALSVALDETMPALELSAQRRKEATFAAIGRQVAALAETRPLLVLVEDMQWSDPTTRELLDHLFGLVQRLPILLLLTYRPEFASPWVSRPGVSVLRLNRLQPRDTAAIASRLATAPMPPELLERLVARSDGVPLFIEELIRFVMESGQNMEALDPALVPDTLQASLLSRLDRLPAARLVAQIGSVIGRSFSHDMAAAIADIPERSLDEGFAQLVDAGLATSRGEAAAATYRFSHALVQDTAYQSMLRSRRAELHAAVVAVLEKDGEAVANDPVLLAHHSAEAGLLPQAVRHFLAAAEQTAARGALSEAYTHLTRGLKLAEDNPDIPDVLVWRTRYQLLLGEVLGALRFYASPDAGAALAEAVTLARVVPATNQARDPLLARSLFGHYVHQLYLGDFRSGRALSDELLALGRERGNPGIATLGAIANGICSVYQGEIVQARALFHATLEAWRPIDFPGAARTLGLDPISVLTVFRARLDALLGFPDTAVAEARHAIERARGLRHVRSLAIVIGTGWDTFAFAGEDGDLRQATREWDALANDQGFRFYLTRARYCSGWVKMRDGDIASGHAMVEAAVRDLNAVGVVLDAPQIHSMLADTREAMGDAAGALAAIERGLEFATSGGVFWWSAELLWRRGRLRLDDPYAAEADFQAALRAARGQSARTQELRAATAYAAWLISVGRGEEAHSVLTPVLGWFTEGLHRPDQRAAAALLTRIDQGVGQGVREGLGSGPRREVWRSGL